MAFDTESTCWATRDQGDPAKVPRGALPEAFVACVARIPVVSVSSYSTMPVNATVAFYL
jgi:hypothetical protein